MSQKASTTPIYSRPLTEEEKREINAFFQKLRAENDKTRR